MAANFYLDQELFRNWTCVCHSWIILAITLTLSKAVESKYPLSDFSLPQHLTKILYYLHCIMFIWMFSSPLTTFVSDYHLELWFDVSFCKLLVHLLNVSCPKSLPLLNFLLHFRFSFWFPVVFSLISDFSLQFVWFDRQFDGFMFLDFFPYFKYHLLTVSVA